jgi:5'-3' exonuclease
MGIKNLHKLLRDKCPDIYRKVPLTKYAYKRIAIDLELYLYKFKAMSQSNRSPDKTGSCDRWLILFIDLICCLRRNNVHCVFLYDGQAPEEKVVEQNRRRSSTESRRRDVDKLKLMLKHYEETQEVSEDLMEYYIRCAKRIGKKRLFLKNKTDVFQYSLVKSCLRKKEGQIIRVTKEDKDLTKKLFEILDVPYIQAKGEGEKVCSNLCINGKVDAVLSNDTDVMAYGSPIFLHDIDTSHNTVMEVVHGDLLESIDMSRESFLDMCIMAGSDFSDMKGMGIGTAYKYISVYESIDTIIQKVKNKDFSTLNHIRVREIFTNHDEGFVNIRFCGIPNMKNLSEFFFDNGIMLGLDLIKEAYMPPKLVFVTEDD